MRVDWEGLVNARTLGGVPLKAGGVTRGDRFVRSDHPANLTSVGWADLVSYGIRTIVSLETGGLEGADALRANRVVIVPSTVDVHVIRVSVEDASDAQFLEQFARPGLWGTPLYFAWVLQRWPALYGSALNRIASVEAPMLLHCGRGHDRTGLLSLLLLTIAGATVEGVTDDYLLSAWNLRAREPEAGTHLERALHAAGTSAYHAIADAMAVIDDDWLTSAGVTISSVSAIRSAIAGG